VSGSQVVAPARRDVRPADGFFRKNAVIGMAEIVGRIPLVFTAGYIARTLGPSVYCNWALVITYSGLLVSIVSLGLPVSLSRLASVDTAPRARGYLNVALRASAVAIVPIALLTLVTLPWLARAIGLGPGLAWLLLLGCLVAIVNGFEALLDAYFKARELVARQSTFVLVRSCIEVLSIVLVFSGTLHLGNLHGAKLLVLYAALNTTLKVVTYPLLVNIRAPRAEVPPPADRRTFVRYGLPMIPAGLVVFLTAQGDRLVLGHLFDKHELGVYAFGAALAAYMAYLGYAINPLLLPRASALHDAGDIGAVQRLFAQSQRVYLILYTAALAGLVLFSREVIELTAGKAYAGSQTVLIVLGAAVGLEALLGIFQWVFHLARRPRYVLWFNIAYMALNITGVIVAASFGGPAAVAVTVLVIVAVLNVARYAIARRMLPVRLEATTVLGLLGLGCVLAPGLVLARGWPLEWRAVLGVAIAGACAMVGAAAVRSFTALPSPAPTSVGPPG
jgi:O-antigen/teichoic acid export membrane protein